MKEHKENSNKLLRSVLGKFTTGVAIITCFENNTPIGATVNSFSSVSLSPPLVLWSMSNSSNTGNVFKKNRYCTVNILSGYQKDLALKFAKSSKDKFNGVKYLSNNYKAPHIENCLAYIECSIENDYPGGDHIIFLGKVNKFYSNNSEPLIFFDGEFRKLQDN